MATPEPICPICRQAILLVFATLRSGAMTHVRCALAREGRRRSRPRRRRLLRLWRLLRRSPAPWQIRTAEQGLVGVGPD